MGKVTISSTGHSFITTSKKGYDSLCNIKAERLQKTITKLNNLDLFRLNFQELTILSDNIENLEVKIIIEKYEKVGDKV